MSDYFCRVYRGAPQALHKVLMLVYPDLPYGLLARLSKRRDVFVNGVRCDGGMVADGSELSLYCTPAMVHLNVVQKEAGLLAVYKPKGVPSDGTYSFEGLVRYVYGDSVRMLHRLDTNTDGLLLFATDEPTYDLLSAGMRTHTIIKYYRALVWGEVDRAQTLRGYLAKDAQKGRVRIYDAPKEDAVSVACQVTPLMTDGRMTVVDICLKGGKTHQLRAQLAHVGHWILGDGKYGNDRINKEYGYRKQQLTSYRVEIHLSETDSPLDGMVITLPEDIVDVHLPHGTRE